MAPSRPLVRILAALGALVLVAGCTDDGETTTAGSGLAMPSETTEAPEGGDPTTTTSEATEPATTTEATPAADPEVVAAACPGLEATILLPVDVEYPDDDSVLLDALNALADARPEPVGEDAAVVRTLMAAEGDPEVEALPPEAIDALVVDAFAALERVQDWGRDACVVEGIGWACPATDGVTKFEMVGEAIGGGDDDTTTTTEPGAATPEQVFTEGVSDGEPVVVSRTEDEVVAAWLDENGDAVEVITVIEDGGWRSDGTQQCLTPEDLVEEPQFETIEPGEEIPG
ncbi:MAG TPA: hypothetical protein VK507_16670 [Iamia sp.]|nr:hypothetical protein [Iamia sp.]